MNEIILKTKKELDVFMNPTRQEILRELGRAGEPVTPKYLSDRLKISPSSVQFHIKKLEELGVVALDHTEMIRGIKARFYKATNAEVSICGSSSDHWEERELIAENCFMNVYRGYKEKLHDCKEMPVQNLPQHLFDMNGIVFLSEEDSQELSSMIRSFMKTHADKESGTVPWEYGIVAYKMEG